MATLSQQLQELATASLASVQLGVCPGCTNDRAFCSCCIEVEAAPEEKSDVKSKGAVVSRAPYERDWLRGGTPVKR
jgi:hypothetical protein